MSSGWADLATLVTRTTAPTSTRETQFTSINDALAARVVQVGPRESLTLPTVWACVRTIAHTVEQLPLRHTIGDASAPLPEWLRVPERDSTFTTSQLLEAWTTDMSSARCRVRLVRCAVCAGPWPPVASHR